MDEEIKTIDIYEEDLVESIALLSNMRDFCLKLTWTEGHEETARALTVAIEAMGALWYEHFWEEETDDSEGCDQAAE